MRRGRARMAILSSNCPAENAEAIETYGRLSEIPVLTHAKDSVDLGVLCGKPYPVSAMVISDPGDSNILEITKED
jgi:large subunit ribosomal protein L30e